MTANELKRRAAELREKILATVNKAEGENREVNEDEASLCTEWRTEAEGYERRAKIVEEAEAAVGKTRGVQPRTSEPLAGRIDPVEGEGDKKRSMADFLVHVATVGDRRNSNYEEIERSRDALCNLYRSEYKEWDSAKRSREVRTMAANSGISGGYTLQTQFYNELMQLAAPMAIVRPRAMVIPMTSGKIKIPMLDQTTAQVAGTPAWFGGVVGTWSGENAQINATEAQFRQGELSLHELTGYTPVSRTLIRQSAISIEALIRQLFAGAIAWYEDYAFLRGNGVGKPLGVLNAPCRVVTAARGSATAITFANARSVWVRVLEESRGAGVWLSSQNAEEKLLDMTGTANSVFVPNGAAYVASTNSNAASQSINYALIGREVKVSSKLPTLNTDGDFGFYDFSKYLIGDDGTMEIAASEDYLFRTNEMAFRFIRNVGGLPWMNAPVTLEDGSTTVSPFVSLGIQ